MTVTKTINITEHILIFILEHIQKYYIPSSKELEKITIEPCKLKTHGDLTTNALMILKKYIPAECTTTLQEVLRKEFSITKIEIVGPGFLNMTFTPEFWKEQLLKEHNIPNIGKGQKILLEFLSTNPTGPVHVGHARIAIVGDALARVLKSCGYNVTKEYYVNDAGAQVIHLGESLKLRYEELQGRVLTEEDFTNDMYPGDYLIEAAKTLSQSLDYIQGDVDFKKYAVQAMMDLIRKDLKKLDITFDVFTSEQEIADQGATQKAFDMLKELGDAKEAILEKPRGYDGPWEPRLQWVFESTKYGDDKDRALKKADGSWTYFAGDVAYHYNKYQRGFSHMINILGADHIGYVKRVEAVVQALSKGQAHLQAVLCQLVKFMKNGEPLKMSKRANTFITMSDVVDEIGPDALRFLLLMRRHDMAYDFDLEKAIEKTKDNPVFYVQYATARIGSLMRRYEGEYNPSHIEFLSDETEIDLIKKLVEFPRIVALSAEHYEPHRVANYCYQLVSDFHSLWSKDGYRFLVDDNPSLSSARMILARKTLEVLKEGLHILGVSAPLEM